MKRLLGLQDIILVNASVIEPSFQLVDPALLVFNLSAKTVNKLPALSPVEFIPNKNSKTMGVKDGITVVFNRPVFSADGEIELINMESGSSEQFDVKDSERVEINGTKLTVRPEKALISDKDYKLRIPADALKDSEGNGYGGIDNYQFRTQVDIAFPSCRLW